ncbi:MAG TPA: malto-oligosyltrehalose synthase [Xanthobacteraceae bacterium]|jgi:(1->4)-alpha-D-glucan 1-alpha-D-glucosylmutase
MADQSSRSAAVTGSAAVPRATYRLQFHKGFGFDQAARLAPYLARLGISHVYASPYLKARPGSTHGYDIVDHNALNPELGDAAAFKRMNTALAANGLKQILDFVPNHMGVGGSDNPLWLDVLEWGQESPYAGWFDIEWDPDQRYLHDKLLVPALGSQYGAVLESGQIALKFDAAEGSFAVWAYGTHRLPISPLHYSRVLGTTHPDLERLGDSFAGLPEWRPQVARRAAELKLELAALAASRPDAREAIEAAVARINGTPGQLETWSGLHALIGLQSWRVAHFRVAADDINYRRFFNINDLAGLRMELPDVFEHTHAFVLSLLSSGTLDGLRIDHIDGLLDPKGYLRRLREKAGSSFYLIVEKILAAHEALRPDWPVQGTTGYEFANLVLGILVDPAGAQGFDRIYRSFAGEQRSFAEIVHACKLRIMADEMASELNALAREAARVARENPRTADFTRNILRSALREVLGCFPVYRTYIDLNEAPTADDRRDLDWALAQARKNEPEIDASVFDFVAALLSGDLVAQPRSGFSRHKALRCAMKLQQYSGPVMAKSLEDTAFYRYSRFIALNEVGGQPDRFGISLSAFHKANAWRAEHWPDTMLCTSTHDTKRGEDTRARLAVLSELPEEWARNVEAWSRILRARRGDASRDAPPDRNDEYLLYQMLVGSWPVELMNDLLDPAALAAYATRIRATLIKSLREAKTHTTWAAPNAAYESAMLDFAGLALDPEHSGSFIATFLPFVQRVARWGAHNTLVQTVLKLTLPGVPDIYQGAELWDLSLVDPDNRRAVDYEQRATVLQELETTLQAHDPGGLQNLFANWQDGRFKLATIAALLRFRREQPDLFARGDYQPLAAEGKEADAVCAFCRSSPGRSLLVATSRFPTRRRSTAGPNASLIIPRALSGRRWRNLLGAEEGESLPPTLAAAELLRFPAAVLVAL